MLKEFHGRHWKLSYLEKKLKQTSAICSDKTTTIMFHVFCATLLISGSACQKVGIKTTRICVGGLAVCK